MKLDEDTEDVVEESLEVSRVVGSADNLLSQSWPDNSCDVEELSMTPRQHSFPWPTLAHTGQSNSPISILGSGSLDPFDSYPVQIDMRAHELVSMCTCGHS